MADIATNLKDWSTTEASNSPSGSTTIGTGLDDNLRRIQATVRADLASKGSDIASAGTTDLGAVAGSFHDITGTTTVTGLGTVSAGITKKVKFEGAVPLIYNATSLILPGGANITTADGDTAEFISEGSGNWRCLDYQPSAYPPKRPVLATVQASTSGATIDFTGIPSWAKRIVVQLAGVSTNGTSSVIIQIGDYGGIENSGYLGASSNHSGTISNLSSGFIVSSVAAATFIHGHFTLTLLDSSTNTWTCFGAVGHSNAGNLYYGAGQKPLSATLDRVRITTAGGTDTFDAGSINILYD